MTNTEIKKLYTKTKKAFEKRTGEKHTWVMNAKQQRLGTATVMTDFIMDFEEQIARCERNLAEFDTKRWPERRDDYLKRAREEKRRNDGWTFWQERTTPEYLEKARQEMLDMFTRELEEKKAQLQKYGTYTEQHERAVKHAKEMIQSPEVQDFLKAIGGQATLDIKSHGASPHSYSCTEVYVRFYYQAIEA